MDLSRKIFFSLLISLVSVGISAQLSVQVNSTNVSCFNGSDGTGEVISVTGGVSPYTYQWEYNDFTPIVDSTNSTISGLPAGFYFIRVKDSSFPQKIGIEIISILNGPNIAVNPIGSNVTCNGADDGSILIFAAGGNSPLEYSINGGTDYQSSNLFSDLPPGDYNIIISDSKGCTKTYGSNPLKITQPDPLVTSLVSKTDIDCFGADNGAIDASTIGGTAPYDFSWSSGETTEDISSLPAGDYTLTVEDASLCGTSLGPIKIIEAPQIVISNIAATDESCFNFKDGTVTVTASGGTGALDYTLTPTVGPPLNNNDGLFTGLSGDTYTLSVTDTKGCGPVVQGGIFIDNPPVISVGTWDTTSITCNGADNGIITVTGAGGTPPYSYTLNPGSIPSASGNFTGLGPAPGYQVSITDANTCPVATSLSWDFTEPAPIAISLDAATDVTCNGDGDGTITVSATGGSLSYIYTLTPGPVVQTNGNFIGLSGGIYSVSVTDTKGCAPAVAGGINITDPDPISIDLIDTSDITCFGYGDGIVDVTASGGTGLLHFTLNPGGLTNNDGNFTGLGPATYDVSVTDDNTCPAATAANLLVNEPAVISIDIETSTPIQCFASDDGSITIVASGGIAPLDYTLNDPGATNNATGIFLGLTPQLGYQVSVTDANACPAKTSTPVDMIEPGIITLDGVDTNDVTCNGAGDGSLSVIAGGGTAPYTYTLSPGSVAQGTGDFTNLPGGTYSVSVTDSRACPPASVTDMVILDPAPISISTIDTTDISCNGAGDGTVIVTASGGTGLLHFTLNPGGFTNNDGNFTGLGPAIYDVSVTDDNGCPAATAANLVVIEPALISIFSETSTPIQCFNSNDGSITVVAAGGTPPFDYTLNPGGANNATGIFMGLTPALGYQVTITDANGCPAIGSTPVDMIEPGIITLDGVDTNDVTCNGAADGSLSVIAGGGTAPYTYTLSPGSVAQGTGDFINLPGGTYAVSVTDSRACPPASVTDMVILDPAPISISTIDTTDVTCNGAGDGSIVVTASGGTGTLYYSLTPGPINNTDGNFTGLSGNTYSLSITDDNTCPPATAANLVVNEPLAISIDIEDTTGISCFGANDAIIQITASGGVGTLTYTLRDPGVVEINQTGLFENLGTGPYTVGVDDENGCGPKYSNAFTFVDPAPLAVSVDASSSKVLTCFGDSTGTLNISVTGGYTPYNYNWTGPNGYTNNIEDISGLKAGDYNLTITDARSCVLSEAPLDSIIGPPQLTMSLLKNDVTCNGDGDGSVVITAVGGTIPYQYSRNGFTWQGSGTFSSLNPGSYTFYTRDGNSCISTQKDTIIQPQEIKINQIIKDNQYQKCYGDSNGIITITAIGGTGMLQYSIDTGNNYFPNNVFAGLAGGVYWVAVRDANSCEVIDGAGTFIDNPPLLYIDTLVQQDITSCFASPEGKVFIEGGGGFPPMNYILDAADTNLTGLFENLMQGNHDLQILDTKGCTKDTSIFINSPPPIITSLSVTNVTTCLEDSSGAIAIIASGGVGLTKGYVLQGDTTLTSDTAFYNNLPGGSYDFTIFDSLGCEVFPTAEIIAPDSISSDSARVFTVTCFGNTDGEIRIYGAGGTQPYSYILNPGAGADTNATGIFTNLAAGDYTVSINDVVGCKPFITATLTVIEPPTLVFDSSASTAISCGGFNDGVIAIFASGGLPPYSYSVDDGATYGPNLVVTGLGPGSHIIYVKDSAGCSVPGDTIILADPPGLSLDPSTVTDVALCAGDSSGVLSVSASGGTGALEYSLDSSSWQSAGNFNNLPAGIYVAVVRDSKSCILAFPADTIGEPPVITATITTATAMIPAPGAISISATGGTPPLEYSIDSGAIFSSQTDYSVPSDIYGIVVRDANGCTYEESVFVPATPPLEVNVSSNNIDCFGNNNGRISLAHLNGIGTVNYSIEGGLNPQLSGDFTGLAGGTYPIYVSDSHRVFRDTVIIINPPPFDVTSSIKEALCSRNSFDGAISLLVSGASPPYTYLWSNGETTRDISGLEGMDYSIIITDLNSCELSMDYTVPALINLIADAGPDTVVCYGTEVTLNGSGGDEFTWGPEELISNAYVPNPTTTVTDSVALSLFTRDQTSGCSDRDTVYLMPHPDRGISAGQDTTVAPRQTIILSATGGPFSSYLWEPADGLDNPSSQTTNALISTDITYMVTGTTEFGCEESDSMSISIATGLGIYSGFTPNGNGTNDYWDIDDIIFYPNATVKVFDRWGRTVFSSVGYSDNQRWDGKYKGKDLPTGTYYYIIDLKDGSEPYKGPVTIVR